MIVSFENNITFFSNFDSGNLAKVVEVKKDASNSKEIDHEFNLWTRPDAAGTQFENGNRTWFYFAVRGVEKGKRVRMNIMNMNKQRKLYNAGYTPIFKVKVFSKMDSVEKEEPSKAPDLKSQSSVKSFKCINNNNKAKEMKVNKVNSVNNNNNNNNNNNDNNNDNKNTINDNDFVINLDINGVNNKIEIYNINAKIPINYIKTPNNNTKTPNNTNNPTTSFNKTHTPPKTPSTNETPPSTPNNKITPINTNNTNMPNNNIPINNIPNNNISINNNNNGNITTPRNSPVIKAFTNNSLKWQRVRDKVTFTTTDNINHILTFSHLFDHAQTSTTYFAFAFPWTYEQNQRKLEYLDLLFVPKKFPKNKKQPNDTIYYHRELLAYSLDKNRIDLITISDHSSISQSREERFDEVNLFPDYSLKRCFSFVNKKVFFISSRVHPGETPASHVFNGILDFLLDNRDLRAKMLRKKFVFKLIPMLNPDGVKRGHYRTDQNGVNLNRFYLNPNPTLHPSIYAAKSLLTYHHCGADKFKNLMVEVGAGSGTREEEKPLTSESISGKHSKNDVTPGKTEKMQAVVGTKISSQILLLSKFTPDVSSPLFAQHSQTHYNAPYHQPNLSHPSLLQISPQQSGVAFYVDLHAHSSKKGCFFYGNFFDDEHLQTECITYAKLVSLNSPHFDLPGCNFTHSNMYTADKQDTLSKEGSGRVATYKHLGIVHCYTLECNYNTGRMVYSIPPLTSVRTPLPPPSPPQKYTIPHFEDVGRAVLIAALDYHNCNPCSRLNRSDFVNMDNLREHIRQKRLYNRGSNIKMKLGKDWGKTSVRKESVVIRNITKSSFKSETSTQHIIMPKSASKAISSAKKNWKAKNSPMSSRNEKESLKTFSKEEVRMLEKEAFSKSDSKIPAVKIECSLSSPSILPPSSLQLTEAITLALSASKSISADQK